MSSLRSALDELRIEDLDRLTDVGLEEDFAELERAARTLDVERARRLAAIDRREPWRRDGFLSTSAWLAHRFRMGWAAVTRQLRQAAALEVKPATAEALASAEISPCAAAVLIAAREVHPEEFARQEGLLVEAARTLSVRELRRAVSYWREALNGPRALEDAEFVGELRRLYLSPTLEGTVRVDGDLDRHDPGASCAAVAREVRRRWRAGMSKGLRVRGCDPC